MHSSSNIFLVGPMGAGKSTIGRLLAKNMNRTFIDLDAEIEHRCGADIPWIFDVEGEAGFRRRESNLLQEITDQRGIMLATGGGAVLDEGNRLCLKEKGFVVYLRATLQQLVERTSRDRKRPLLQVENPEAVLTSLLEQREPLYLEIADLIVETETRSPQLVAKEIEKKILAELGE